MAKPFVSQAQMERSKRLVAEGVLTQAQFDEALAATHEPHKLPERLHPKKPKTDAEDAADDSRFESRRDDKLA